MCHLSPKWLARLLAEWTGLLNLNINATITMAVKRKGALTQGTRCPSSGNTCWGSSRPVPHPKEAAPCLTLRRNRGRRSMALIGWRRTGNRQSCGASSNRNAWKRMWVLYKNESPMQGPKRRFSSKSTGRGWKNSLTGGRIIVFSGSLIWHGRRRSRRWSTLTRLS